MASLNLAHIKSMSIRYFPYDSSAKLCRELLRRVRPCSAQVLLTISFPHATRFIFFFFFLKEESRKIEKIYTASSSCSYAVILAASLPCTVMRCCCYIRLCSFRFFFLSFFSLTFPLLPHHCNSSFTCTIPSLYFRLMCRQCGAQMQSVPSRPMWNQRRYATQRPSILMVGP